MIDFALKYQSVIFGSFEEITPNADNFKYFIDEFRDKELIPAMFQEVSAKGVKNRFILKSQNDEWNIEFGSDRLDIKKVNRNINVINFGNKEGFLKDVLSILEVVFSKFPRKSNRISFISHYFCKPLKTQELNNIILNISDLPKTFINNPPVNWNHRYVSRIEKMINKKKELLNFIGEINRIQGRLKIDSEIKDFDRIELKFDINTFQNNQDYRFEQNDLVDFYTKVNKWENDLLNEFIQLMEQ
ncbi:MAG: hypothetical protein ACTSXT_09575 [Candidatus Helarchaeota archaeon]